MAFQASIDPAGLVRDFLIDKEWNGKVYATKRVLKIFIEAIAINGQEMVFDNIDHDGVTSEEWWQNFTSPTVELGRGSFNLTELDF